MASLLKPHLSRFLPLRDRWIKRRWLRRIVAALGWSIEAEGLAHRGKRSIGHGGVALRSRVDGATVDCREHAPGRVVDVRWLQRRAKPLRISHRGEIAVIGGAHPALARRIGAELAGAAAAGHRVGCG